MKEMVLGGGALILALAALRRLMRGKLDPRLQYALWLLVALRLLIPGALFSSPAALPVAEADPAAVAGEAMDSVLDWGKDVPLISYPGSERTWTPSWVPEEELSGESQGDSQGNESYALTATWTGFFRFWTPVVWVAGMALAAVWMLLVNWRFYRGLIARRRRLELPPEAGAGKLRVYAVKGLESPCLFGLFRPAVYVDSRETDPARLRHILTHEHTHYRHGDHLWVLVRSACLVLHWFNPLVWWAAAMSRRDCELACDAGVLDRLGDGERVPYGETLLAVAAGRGRLGGLLRTSTAMNESKKTMKERIAMIVKRPRMLRITLALVLVLAALAAAVTFGGQEAEAAGTEDGDASGGEVTPPDNDGGQTDTPVTPLPTLTDQEVRANGEEILARIDAGADPSEWIPLLRDLRWITAFSTGDPEETTGRLERVMDQLDFCVSGKTDLTDREWLDILSANQDLDGAYAEYYQEIVWRMYLRDSDRFLALLREGMDDKQRTAVLWWVKGELVIDGYAESTGELTDEEALSILENEPLLRIYVESPLRFTQAGEVGQIRVKNLPEVGGMVTYWTGDTDVATVDDTGLVTAVGPGVATVVVRYSGPAGERELYCYVHVEPEKNGEQPEGQTGGQDAAEPDDGDLVAVTDYIPSLYVDLKYATEDNFTGQVIYDFTSPRLRYGTVKKLAAVQAELLERGYSLKIWDACRPVSAQFKLWEAYPDARYVANPNTGYSNHCRGGTVDVTLVLRDGTEISMPSGFDEFSALADRDYGDVSREAADNARLLERAMEAHGFTGYAAEWWHYSDGVTYPVVEE